MEWRTVPARGTGGVPPIGRRAQKKPSGTIGSKYLLCYDGGMAQLESPTGTTDLLAVARSLAAIAGRGASVSEQQGYLADDTVAALRASGLFATLR